MSNENDIGPIDASPTVLAFEADATRRTNESMVLVDSHERYCDCESPENHDLYMIDEGAVRLVVRVYGDRARRTEFLDEGRLGLRVQSDCEQSPSMGNRDVGAVLSDESQPSERFGPEGWRMFDVRILVEGQLGTPLIVSWTVDPSVSSADTVDYWSSSQLGASTYVRVTSPGAITVNGTNSGTFTRLTGSKFEAGGFTVRWYSGGGYSPVSYNVSNSAYIES